MTLDYIKKKIGKTPTIFKAGVLVFLIALIWFIFSAPQSTWQSFDSDYKPIKMVLSKELRGEKAVLSLVKNSGTLSFAPAAHPAAKLFTTLQNADFSKPPKTSGNKIRWSEVMPDIDLELHLFDGQVKEFIYIKSKQAPHEFSFDLTKADNLILREQGGSYITVLDKDTEEELFTLDFPIAYDQEGFPVPYHYKLSNDQNTLVLEVHDPRDLEKDLEYPLILDPPMTVREYDVALVKIGENCSGSNCAKDGDIITVKPMGWRWGDDEYKEYVIVRIPKLSEEERIKFSKQEYTFLREDEVREPVDNPMQNAHRYGIDYSKLVDGKVLENTIHNRAKKNPILDATNLNLEEIIIEKSWGITLDTARTRLAQDNSDKTSIDDLLAILPDNDSVVPQDTRLAMRVPARQSWLAKIFKPTVKAAGTITTDIGSTCDGSCSYSTLAAWETACGGATSCDLVTNTEIAKGEAYNDATFAENVTINSFTSGSASYYPWLTVASGERHNGTAGTGAKIDPSASGHAVQIDDANTLLEWFEITGVQANSDEAVRINAADITVQYLLVHDLEIDTEHDGVYQGDTSYNVTVRNSIFYNIARSAIHAQAYSFSNARTQVWTVDNITVVRAGNVTSSAGGGIQIWARNASSNITVNSNNVIAMGTLNSQSDWQITAGSGTATHGGNYNMDSDATAPGANSLNSKTLANQFTNSTDGTEDLHLKGGSPAVDAGTDLSGNFTDDIDADTRPSGGVWDIGADEYVYSISDAWWDTSWKKRVKITLDNSGQTTGYDNFPAAVFLTATSSRINYASIQDNGEDIRFVDADNSTALNYEIEKYDETATSTIWVKVPAIAAASSTDHIWMYYGNSAATDNSTTTGVWDENFTGVWHLTGVDDSENNNSFDNTGAATTTSKLIDGFNFVESETDIMVANNIDPTGNDFTQTIWYNPNVETQTTYGGLMVGANGGIDRYIIRVSGSQNIRHGFRNSGATVYEWDSSFDFVVGNWYLLNSVYDSSAGTFKFYVNGVEDLSNSPGTQTLQKLSADLVLGRTFSTSHYLDAKLDEVRESQVARSADWIAFEYCNMNDTCGSYAEEEALIDNSTWCSSYTSWDKRIRIDLNNSSQTTGYDNFPAAVLLNSSRIDYTKTQSAGQDIRFCDADNATTLNYEIEKFDETATSTIWVKVPHITSASSTDHIWMYYDNIVADDSATTTGVWDENFVMVQHLQESSGTLFDSTNNSNDGTAVGDTTYTGSGKVGGAYNFQGSGDYVSVADSATTVFTVAAGWTVGAWISHDTAISSGIAEYIMIKNNEITLEFDNGDNGEQSSWVYSGSWTQAVKGTKAAWNANQWYYLTYRHDGSGTAYLYVDGSQDNSAAWSTDPTNGTGVLEISASTASSWTGEIDEFRISNIGRSADWIAFEYCNMNDTCGTYNTFENQSGTLSLSSVTDTPDPTNLGRSVTFSADWSGGSGLVKAKICKTDSLTNQVCDGGSWATSTAFTTRDPENIAYDVVSGDAGQTRNYWTFVCDDSASCTSSTSGTFSVNAQSTVPNVLFR